MQNQRILDNVEPFNDVLYQRNCFLHSLFPIIHHFDRTILPFLLNDIYIFEYNTSRALASFWLKFYNIKPHTELLKEMAIEQKAWTAREDVVGCIKESINSGKPVIVMADCFYLPLRAENYQKQHAPHFILIYGYDEGSMSFNTIDNSTKEGYIYKKYSLEYSIVRDSYNSVLTHSNNYESFLTYYDYSLSHGEEYISNEAIHKKYMGTFIQEMMDNKDRIYGSLENIKVFTKNMSEYLKDISTLKEKGDDIIESTNVVIANRIVDKYRLFRVFESHRPAWEALEAIIGNWCYLRACLMKSIKTEDLRPETASFSVAKLNEIWNLENAYHDSFYKLLEDWRCRL